MPDDNYYDRIYHQLVDILEGEGLSWLVREVNKQILMGKVIFPEKKIRRTKTAFTYSTDYSPKERLESLINAIKHVIVNSADMEEAILLFFRQASNARPDFLPIEIRFHSEIDEQDTIIDRQQTPIRQNQAHRIGELLNKLQRRIDDNN